MGVFTIIRVEATLDVAAEDSFGGSRMNANHGPIKANRSTSRVCQAAQDKRIEGVADTHRFTSGLEAGPTKVAGAEARCWQG